MQPGDFCDTESIREAIGPASFAVLEQALRDKYAAQLALYAAESGRIAAASERIEWAANDNLGGLRPAFNMHPALWAQLNRDEPGWQDDPSFLKDLYRHQPETKVNIKSGGATNRVGWTPSMNKSAAPRHTATAAAAPVNKSALVLTDKRGNAA